jgi:lysophospholipase L1-like esterase
VSSRRRFTVVAAMAVAVPLVFGGGAAAGHRHGRGPVPAQASLAHQAGPVPRPGAPRTLTQVGLATSDVARLPTIRIMPLGDSITLGGGSRTMSGYRVDLAKRLRATGLNVDFVGSQHDGAGPDTDHEGHSHWTIEDIAAHVDRWLATYRPDVILLNVGTNNTASTAMAARAPGAFSALIDQIRADRPTAELFVTKITNTKNVERQPLVAAYNAAVPGIVARKGPRVHLVDQSSIGGRDLRDNLHPNDVGYAKMSANFYHALKPVLAPGARRWPAGDDPYAATAQYVCSAVNPYVFTSPSDCRWWHLRTVTDGGVRARVWQTIRTVPRAYRVYVGAAGGRSAGTPEAGHLATRYRPVSVWSSR